MTKQHNNNKQILLKYSGLGLIVAAAVNHSLKGFDNAVLGFYIIGISLLGTHIIYQYKARFKDKE